MLREPSKTAKFRTVGGGVFGSIGRMDGPKKSLGGGAFENGGFNM